MTEIDYAQWVADNDRLLIAGLSNGSKEDPLSGDLETIKAVKRRCIDMLGEEEGLDYFKNMVATLPTRRPELFPELSE